MLILAHPNFKESIVNKALIKKLSDCNHVFINDLCEACNGGKFDIEKEQEKLVENDRIIFQFPLYWYSFPAILKKWIDDVFTPGFAYGRKGKEFGTKLVGKQFSIISTIGGVEAMYVPGGIIGLSMNELFKHIQATVEYVGGVYTNPHYIFGAAFLKNEDDLKEKADSYMDYILNGYIPKEKQYEKLVKLAYEHKAKGYY